MRMLLLLACLLVCTVSAVAEPEADTKTTTVIAEGVGKDEKEARKAAFRDAVAKVVGTIVDIDTQVKNDEVISERILEYSGGFIKTYDTLKTEKTGDMLVRVRIKATVERNQIVGKLADAKITVKEVKGADLLAEKMTKDEARKNATELLAKLFADLPKMVEAEVIGKPKLNKDGDGLVIKVNVRVNAKAYGEFAKKAVPLLEKIAVEKDSVFETAIPVQGKQGLFEYKSSASNRLWGVIDNDQRKKGWPIRMLTYVDGKNEKARWNWYWIDSDRKATVSKLSDELRLHLTLEDASDEKIGEDEISLDLSRPRAVPRLRVTAF